MNIVEDIVKPEDCVFAFGIPTSKEDFLKDQNSENKDFARTVKGNWLQYKTGVVNILRAVEPIIRDLGVRIIHRLTFRDFAGLFKDRKAKIILLFTHWKDEPNRTVFSKQEYLGFLKKHADFLEFVPHERALLEWIKTNCNQLDSLAGIKLSGQKGQEEAPIVRVKQQEIEADYDQIVFDYLREISADTYLELLRHSTTSEVEFYDGLKSIYEIVCQIPARYQGFLDLNVCQCDDLTMALRKCRPACHFKFKRDDPEEDEDAGVKPDSMLLFYLIFFKHLASRNLSYLQAFKEVFAAFIKLSKRKGGKLEAFKKYL